jgi:hypothetical protein
MGDLDFKDRSEPVAIIGCNLSQSETTPVNSSSVGELFSKDTIRVSGNDFALSIGTSAIEVKSGASRLTSRTGVYVWNNSNSIIYWGCTSGVSTTTGKPIFRNTGGFIDASDEVSIYLIASSASNDVRCSER